MVVRVAAIVLVVLGALGLAAQGFGWWPPAATSPESRTTRAEADAPARVVPLISGVALVGGLLLLVGTTRRD